MESVMVKLERLEAHPANSNVMAEELLTKLAGHIERTGRYPPVIVRIAPGQVGQYQLLDGHHRVEALRRLQHAEARCVVWEVDDDEALLLLATLNRLQGRDDPYKRAALLASLHERHELRELARLLPERMAEARALMELHRPPPPPRPPQMLEDMPRAVHFFLLPAQRETLEACLQNIGGTREEALMQLVEHPEHRPGRAVLEREETPCPS